MVNDGTKSTPLPVSSGVLQGTVLGPLLFLAYIYDMPECIRSTVKLFADDSLVYRNISNKRDCEELQQNLYRLQEWDKKWQMAFNAENLGPRLGHLAAMQRPCPPLYDVPDSSPTGRHPPEWYLTPLDNRTRGRNTQFRLIPTSFNGYEQSFFPRTIVLKNQLPQEAVRVFTGSGLITGSDRIGPDRARNLPFSYFF